MLMLDNGEGKERFNYDEIISKMISIFTYNVIDGFGGINLIRLNKFKEVGQWLKFSCVRLAKRQLKDKACCSIIIAQLRMITFIFLSCLSCLHKLLLLLLFSV